MSILRQNVIAARKRAGLSQHKLACAMGWTQDNYNKLETGKRNISEETIEKLANIPELGLTLIELQAWKLLDTYSADVILKAIEEVEKERNA